MPAMLPSNLVIRKIEEWSGLKFQILFENLREKIVNQRVYHVGTNLI